MDSNQLNQQPKPQIEQESWKIMKKAITFFSSSWKYSLIFFGILALVIVTIVLALFPTKKTINKTPPTIQVPKSDSSNQIGQQNNSYSASDPTKDWDVISKGIINLKAPTGSQVSYEENYNGASESAFLQLTLDPQKQASEQGVLVVEVTNQKVALSQQVYQLNLVAPTTKRIITKPIEILIGGNKGFEFYLESSGLKTSLRDYSSPLAKNRVIQFDKDNKSYLIFSPLNGVGAQILNTIILP